MIDEVFRRCQDAFPGWADLTIDQVEFDAPKGFSTFTMGVRPTLAVDPPAVLYRHLAGKENAILDSDAERRLFLLLGEEGIAARCLHHDDVCRIEEFYVGRTMTGDEVYDPALQRGVAAQLHRLHQLDPPGLPEQSFFELLHERWGPMARSVLEDHCHEFPADEQPLCDELAAIHQPETLRKVMDFLPDRPPVFCHNDTYHGNTFLLDDGQVRLLDFEFSCRNHIAFDVANLFAETKMIHGLADPPHFAIGPQRASVDDLARFVGAYLDNEPGLSAGEREVRQAQLVEETRLALSLSDYMYAMAALPLALEPVQKIRFLPYAHQRFNVFLDSWQAEFG